MEEKDFASAANDLLMIEGLLCLRFKSVVDMFIEASEILESPKIKTSVVSKSCNESFDKKIITKKIRSKRSKKINLDNILKRFGWKKKCLKRKAKEESSSMPSKKHKNNTSNNINNFNDPMQMQEQPNLPTAFKELIEKMEGGEVKLVIQKELTDTDLKPNNGRFSIPRQKTQEKNFLTPSEESLLDVREGKNKRLLGMSMSVLGPNLKLYDNMWFKKWEMKTTNVYNITHGWNKLVKENLLQARDKVQLWSFRNRTHHQLSFALVKL